jgi:hypothetical protein
MKATGTKYKFTFIQQDKEIILMDNREQYYVRVTQMNETNVRDLVIRTLFVNKNWPYKLAINQVSGALILQLICAVISALWI